MKKLVILLISGSLGIFLTSCYKCETCTLNDGSKVVATYNQFCGTNSEIKSFQKDIEFDAANLQHVSCTIYAMDYVTILKAYDNVYGPKDSIDKFMQYATSRAAIENGTAVFTGVRSEFASINCVQN